MIVSAAMRGGTAILLAGCIAVWPGLRASSAPAYPTIAEAEASLAAGDLDGVYIAFGSIKPGRHPEGDDKVALLLVHGARRAAQVGDWALVSGFATKARQLDARNVDAWLVEADAAKAIQHHSEEEDALDGAVKIAPSSWPIVLRLATLARDEKELEKAHDLLNRIPEGVPESATASRMLEEIDATILKAHPAPAPPPPPLPGPKARYARRDAASVPTSEADAPVPGYAARASEHFRITYSEGNRDFAQKAGYEQQCLDLLERAYAKVQRSLGATTDHPTDVVLYARQEFELHFGGRFGNTLLGFYAGKIRMNRADTIDDSFFDTAVHEYTHAAIDSMAQGHRVPMWVHEGLARWVERTSAGRDPVEAGEKRLLRSFQKSQRMPTLSQLAEHSFMDFQGPMVTVAYEKSALAIDLLTRTGTGLVGLERVFRASAGKPFDEAFTDEFGTGKIAALEEEVTSQLE